MTLRWLISFSLIAAPLAAATLTGGVQLKDSRELRVKKNLDSSGVVVWLTPKDGQYKTSVVPARGQIIQKGKRFEPHVLPLLVGGSVDFPNLDPIFHNAFSNFDGKVFDLGLYPPGQSRSVRFDRAGIVRMFCNIHATMSAIVVVLQTPYFATSKADGRWEIKDVPPGEYQLSVFHERSTNEVLRNLERSVRVQESSMELPVFVISESGYAVKPHPNKFGKAYAPGDSNPIYPGVKN